MTDCAPREVPERNEPSIAEIQNWLISGIASELAISPQSIQTDKPIVSYGIDSMQMVSLLAAIEDRLQIRFAYNPLEDHPTVELLARFALEHLHDEGSPVD